MKIFTPTYPLFGITNGFGGFWTHETFTTEAAAKAYMERFWGKGKVPAEHMIIPVRMSVEDARGGRPSLTQAGALAVWREHGGTTHGPNVEHVSMPLERFLGFCKAILNA